MLQFSSHFTSLRLLLFLFLFMSIRCLCVCFFLLPLIIANIFTPIHLYNYVDLHVCNESLDKYSTVMRHLIDFSVISDWILFNFAVPYWTCGGLYTYWNECVITTSKMMMMMMKKKTTQEIAFYFPFWLLFAYRWPLWNTSVCRCSFSSVVCSFNRSTFTIQFLSSSSASSSLLLLPLTLSSLLPVVVVVAPLLCLTKFNRINFTHWHYNLQYFFFPPVKRSTWKEEEKKIAQTCRKVRA